MSGRYFVLLLLAFLAVVFVVAESSPLERELADLERSASMVQQQLSSVRERLDSLYSRLDSDGLNEKLVRLNASYAELPGIINGLQQKLDLLKNQRPVRVGEVRQVSSDLSLARLRLKLLPGIISRIEAERNMVGKEVSVLEARQKQSEEVLLTINIKIDEVKRKLGLLPPPVCTDSDGGIEPDVPGRVNGEEPGVHNHIILEDSCTFMPNGGIKLKEWYCKKGFAYSKLFSCACINEAYDYRMSSARCAYNLPDVACYDSDNGSDFFTKGFIFIKEEGEEKGESDMCVNEFSLIEFSCYAPFSVMGRRTCPLGCKDGACVAGDEPQKPDLVIEGFGPLYDKTNGTGIAVIGNRGTVAANDVVVKVTDCTESCVVVAEKVIPQIDSGRIFRLTWTVNSSLLNRSWVIEADPANLIDELREDNNVEKSFGPEVDERARPKG